MSLTAPAAARVPFDLLHLPVEQEDVGCMATASLEQRDDRSLDSRPYVQRRVSRTAYRLDGSRSSIPPPSPWALGGPRRGRRRSGSRSGETAPPSGARGTRSSPIQAPWRFWVSGHSLLTLASRTDTSLRWRGPVAGRGRRRYHDAPMSARDCVTPCEQVPARALGVPRRARVAARPPESGARFPAARSAPAAPATSCAGPCAGRWGWR